MSRWIKNFDSLATNECRKHALEIAEAGYSAIETEAVIKNLVRIENNQLKVKDATYNLADYKNIYLLGCGKVACKAAEVLEEIIGERLNAGAVIGIKPASCSVVETYAGTHPMPSKTNFTAASRIKEIGESATKDDLVIAIIGGGGSSLLCDGQSECDQGQELYKAFLDSGGYIKDLNLVRKHISNIKGGGLAKILYPAKVVALIFSDVPGDDHSFVASGPTYKDESTVEDAQKIIDKYKLGSFELVETPKEDKYFEKVDNILLVSNHLALGAMQQKAEELGYKAIYAGCDLYEFPEDVLKILEEKAEPNSVVVAGGETRLNVPKSGGGKGGRSDMLGLTALSSIKDDQVFLPFASDGYDNTDSAGVLVDIETKNQAKELKIDIEDHKKRLDSYPVFERLNSQVFTGRIEANISDLMLLMTCKDGEY